MLYPTSFTRAAWKSSRNPEDDSSPTMTGSKESNNTTWDFYSPCSVALRVPQSHRCLQQSFLVFRELSQTQWAPVSHSVQRAQIPSLTVFSELKLMLSINATSTIVIREEPFTSTETCALHSYGAIYLKVSQKMSVLRGGKILSSCSPLVQNF